ncbi:MAG: hypothetical protein UV68_C0002G0012 [Candidatus Collierbacteria bacterium GW2011_GWC2_43_12]|uniref:Uncharacterized protein n=1 Tax=Candidatus Collierbacteria bacterium GW2011_GWC2_43_12 TaxID=1618390 RepID=A0A0G1DAW8_9BACT|nr:MAG: hypothetical protein UV68_C0002G0012 [Candidatus Collierbacteria bacterium GW2011_GWC2_43_12]
MEDTTQENSPESVNPTLRWFAFILFSLASLFLLYAYTTGQLGENDGMVWVFFPLLAVVCIPNKKIQAWLNGQLKKITSLFKGLLSLGIGLVILGVVIWGAWAVLNGIGNGLGSIGRYEGQTAEEWFNDYSEMEDKYQQFRSCVEDYDNFDVLTQIRYGGVFYYCE